jgi:hypothetical protein
MSTFGLEQLTARPELKKAIADQARESDKSAEVDVTHLPN